MGKSETVADKIKLSYVPLGFLIEILLVGIITFLVESDFSKKNELSDNFLNVN